MTVLYQRHGGEAKVRTATAIHELEFEAAIPAGGDVAVDEQADFGYYFRHPTIRTTTCLRPEKPWASLTSSATSWSMPQLPAPATPIPPFRPF